MKIFYKAFLFFVGTLEKLKLPLTQNARKLRQIIGRRSILINSFEYLILNFWPTSSFKFFVFLFKFLASDHIYNFDSNRGNFFLQLIFNSPSFFSTYQHEIYSLFHLCAKLSTKMLKDIWGPFATNMDSCRNSSTFLMTIFP